jgi:hypothetical protein
MKEKEPSEMSTYPTRFTKATTRRIIVAAILSPAAALLVLSPSANAAHQVAINGPVKDSIVQKQNLSEAPDAKLRNLTSGTHIRCIRIRVWHDGYVLTRVRCVGWRD